MVMLVTAKDLRSVQSLPFCYLCGEKFAPGDDINRDHVPPQSAFLPRDRQPLWLPTHAKCNHAYHLTDEKIGQLIALRNHKVPTHQKNRKLRFNHHGAILEEDLPIKGAIWRWISGFHAALYRAPAVGINKFGAIETPFPLGRAEGNRIVLESVKPQHLRFVETIKLNRLKRNLDVVSANRGKLRYDCVWAQADNNGPWMCAFALDIYDWKDLGAARAQPARGCAGFYILPSGDVPENATRAMTSSIIIPNYDPLDPFAP